MHSLRLEPRRDWELLLPVPNAYLPTTATVPLKQHRGKAARRVVEVGTVVREGMVLAVPDGELSTYIHSPIPGTVRSVSVSRLPEGGECEAVEILLSGSFDRLGKRPERYIWKGMRRADLLQTLRAKGVVETSGKGMPLDALIESKKRGCHIVINALDREPYLRTETSIAESRIGDLLDAVLIVASLVEAATIKIVVDGEGPQSLQSIETFAPLKKDGSYGVELVRSMGGQNAADPGKIRKSGPGSESLHLLPSTLVAIYDAIVEGKAFVERYVTVAGGAIRRPAVLKARIGTPIGDLIEECGGFVESPERLVLGGPLTGFPALNLDLPLTKMIGGVLALTPPETRRGKVRPCIRCGLCGEFCPVGIDPEIIFRDLTGGRIVEAKARGLGSCISCGICSYVCPSRIELSQCLSAHAGG
ncbi:MAG TPA: SLBB domain-containing protein [Rectinemataceae bacterium]|nr:SLBB domain-containing protein [Rectinemataceae bacterium]